jgi:hypothetical protein
MCAGLNAADAQGQSPAAVAPAPAAHPRSAVTTAWKEAINDDGIVVHKRKRAGSAYEEVRATTIMAARVEDFIPFFNEPSNYRKWVYGTIESRQVSRAAAMDFVFYGVFKIPWPFENRELFSRVEMLRDEKNNELQARLTDYSSGVPVGADLVRVAQFESLWKVRGVPNDKVDFSIEMYAEPGGNLPPFIVNLVLSRIQLWSMKNLRTQILNRKN